MTDLTVNEILYFAGTFIFMLGLEGACDYAVATLSIAPPLTPIAKSSMKIYHRSRWLITLATFFMFSYMVVRSVSLQFVLLALIASVAWSLHYQIRFKSQERPYLYEPGSYGADSSLYFVARRINRRLNLNISAPFLSIFFKVLFLAAMSTVYHYLIKMKNPKKVYEPKIASIANADRIAQLPNYWDLAYLKPALYDGMKTPFEDVEKAISGVIRNSMVGEKPPKANLISNTSLLKGDLKGRNAFFFVSTAQGGSLILHGPEKPVKIKVERGVLILVEGYSSYELEPTNSRQRHLIHFTGL